MSLRGFLWPPLVAPRLQHGTFKANRNRRVATMPRGILQDWWYMSVLSWFDIKDLCLSRSLGRLGRLLDQPDFFSSENLELFMERRSELNMIRYRSSTGLLNTSAVDPEAFRLLFRFQKDDFDSLCCSLGVPEVVTSAQGVRVAGAQAMCMTLRRLAYPNRWFDLEPMFGEHFSVMSSVTAQLMTHIIGAHIYTIGCIRLRGSETSF
ncbi:hypothetical protein MRX96_058684 [Rhipicephalus microplus]